MKKKPALGVDCLLFAIIMLAAMGSASLINPPAALAQDGPTIDVWYGLNQTFGLPGVPQVWCDIPGNVSDPDGVAALSYTLNGGDPVDLSVGPDSYRLINPGDFIIDLLVDDLLAGANTIEITAVDELANSSNQTVNLNYAAGNTWPATYTTDWGSLTVDGNPNTPDPAILEMAHVVDGKWSVNGDAIRILEPGYDRNVGLGEMTWQEYEVTVPITFHELLSPTSFGAGLCYRWTGHTDDPHNCAQPQCGYLPLGDIGWIQNGQLSLWHDENDVPFAIELETVYWLKMRVETDAGGVLYSLKAWEDGQVEPDYMVFSDQDGTDYPTAGSLLLKVHEADVSFGNVSIVPITGPNNPPVANDDDVVAFFGGSSYFDILANDTDDDGVLNPATVTIITPPAGGVIDAIDPATGIVTYTHGGGGDPTDTFTYTVEDNDGALSNVATVNVTIGPGPPDDFYSDDFNSCDVDPLWTFVDPQGDATDPVIVGAFTGDAQVALSVPGGSTHQPYGGYLGAPYLMQQAPDKDFTLEVKFSSSLPAISYAEQGILVIQDDSTWLRFDFYSTETGVHVFGTPDDNSEQIFLGDVATPGDSPLYLRIQRTGDNWDLFYSVDGSSWPLAGSLTYALTVYNVGVFVGNADGASAPAFTSHVDYFSNSVDPIVEPDDQEQNSLVVNISGNGSVGMNPDQVVYDCGTPVQLTANPDPEWVFAGWSGDLEGLDNPITITMDRPRFVTATFAPSGGGVIGVTDLAFSKVMTGNPAGNVTAVDLSWTPSIDPDVVEVSVYRKGFGSYPEYSDGGGSAPTLPVDPVAEGWELVETVPVGSNTTTDLAATRDYWYFCALAADAGAGTSPAVMTGGVLNYLLGDVSDGGEPMEDGNNLVWSEDFTLLGSHYGTQDGDLLYLNTLDVGPTSDMSVEGLPSTDNMIEFEDLVLFGLNYSVNVTGQPPSLILHDVPDPAPSNTMALHLPELPEVGQTFQAALVMSGDGQIQGLSIPLAWDPGVVEPMGVQSGPLLDAQGGPVVALSAEPGVVDACLVGIRDNGICGVGTLATVTFRVLAPGSPLLQLADIEARDQSNQPVPITATAATPVEQSGDLPVVSALHPNYPNPFNPMTTIAFELARPGRVKIDIFSLDGRRVRTLVDGSLDAGRHAEVWDGRDQTGRSVASGTYLFTMVGPDIKQTRRMLLVK